MWTERDVAGEGQRREREGEFGVSLRAAQKNFEFFKTSNPTLVFDVEYIYGFV